LELSQHQCHAPQTVIIPPERLFRRSVAGLMEKRSRPGSGSRTGSIAVTGHRDRSGRACTRGRLYPLRGLVSERDQRDALRQAHNFNFIPDIKPVGGITRASQVMVVNPLSSAKTVPEFIAYAKANPGGKPFLHQSGVVIASVVKKDMDERQQRIERLD
jgi:hypothetical protein